MGLEFSKIIIPAIVVLSTGIIGTFFAPWITWGIEKKRSIREERKELILECRKILSEYISSEEFIMNPVYSRIRPYLSPSSKAVEGEICNGVKVVTIVTGNVRHSGINPFRQKILDEIVCLEKKWELI